MTESDYDFAKVFDIYAYEDDQPIKTQVVAIVKTNEDGHPEIRFFTYAGGLFAEMGLGFGPEEGQEDQWEETQAWKQALETFNQIGDEDAENVREQLIAILAEHQQEQEDE